MDMESKRPDNGTSDILEFADENSSVSAYDWVWLHRKSDKQKEEAVA